MKQFRRVDKVSIATRYFTIDIPVPDYDFVTKSDGALITNTDDFGKHLIEMINGLKGRGSLLLDNVCHEMFKRVKIKNESSGIF